MRDLSLSKAFLEGVVFKRAIGNYVVHTPEAVISCSLSPRLRKELVLESESSPVQRGALKTIRKTDHFNPVVVGDHVTIMLTGDGSGAIVAVAPRRNQLTRRSPVPMPTAHPFEQVVAANLDQVMPVFAVADPPPKWNLLDRYLVSAESVGLPTTICLTKLDLLSESDQRDLDQIIEEYRRIGYPVILTSTVSPLGLTELKQTLRGKITVLVGKSGVGKSSLLNAIDPNLDLRVNTVSMATGKGRHTTTHVEMFPLRDGGAVVDTPGMREFGLWEIAGTDLALLFPEMRPWAGRCRFGLNCQHDQEPGCAIQEAVEAGKISPRRYQSYLILKAETR